MQGDTTFHFVTDGIEAALDRAEEAAGDRAVHVAGGADVVQQVLNAGRFDELTIHVSPVFLGAGTRLFDGIDGRTVKLEPLPMPASTAVTHLRYRVR
jgi:dihydrofolate reductase